MLVAARIVTEAGLTENLTEQQTSHPTTIRKTEHHSTNSRRPLHIIKNNRNPIVLKDEKKNSRCKISGKEKRKPPTPLQRKSDFVLSESLRRLFPSSIRGKKTSFCRPMLPLLSIVDAFPKPGTATFSLSPPSSRKRQDETRRIPPPRMVRDSEQNAKEPTDVKFPFF